MNQTYIEVLKTLQTQGTCSDVSCGNCPFWVKRGCKCTVPISTPIKDAATEMLSMLDEKPTEGIKYDEGKPRVGYMFEQFPLALIEVAKVATQGAQEYGAGNWQYVTPERYEDALCRHLLQNGYDDKSGLLHKAHRAWNSLATLELELRKMEEEV